MNLTPNDIRSRLELACEKAGGQRALARKAAVSVTYINDVLNGRVAAGRAILEMLELERVTIVRPEALEMNRRAELVRVVDDPVVGFFRIRKTKGGPFVAARTFQRLGFWGAEIGGISCGASDPDPFKADGVMAVCNTGIRITKDEYDALIGKPALLPERKIDLGALPPPEF